MFPRFCFFPSGPSLCFVPKIRGFFGNFFWAQSTQAGTFLPILGTIFLVHITECRSPRGGGVTQGGNPPPTCLDIKPWSPVLSNIRRVGPWYRTTSLGHDPLTCPSQKAVNVQTLFLCEHVPYVTACSFVLPIVCPSTPEANLAAIACFAQQFLPQQPQCEDCPRCAWPSFGGVLAFCGEPGLILNHQLFPHTPALCIFTIDGHSHCQTLT